jgi:hypothetical protein
MAQLRHMAASRVATSEQRAAAQDELNRHARGECRLTDDQAFYRMSFKEQAALGDQLISARVSSASADVEAKDRGVQCGAIDRELREIWNRYEGGKYVPVEQVERDQLRQRDLTTRRNGLGCASR